MDEISTIGLDIAKQSMRTAQMRRVVREATEERCRRC